MSWRTLLPIAFMMAIMACAPSPAAPAGDPPPVSVGANRTEDGAYVLGSADAPVILEEYADFQ